MGHQRSGGQVERNVLPHHDLIEAVAYALGQVVIIEPVLGHVEPGAERCVAFLEMVPNQWKLKILLQTQPTGSR